MSIHQNEQSSLAPTINKVTVVIVGDAFERRDIQIQRKNNTVHTIENSHRSYDALQYPLIFWEGEDGYHLNIKQINSTTGTIYKYHYLISYFYARLIYFLF